MRHTNLTYAIFGRKSKTAQIDWEAAYEEVLPKVYNYFRYRFFDNSIAEELTSETLTRAWKGRDRYDPQKAAFITWVMGIARFVAIDEFRKHSERPLPIDEIDPVAQEPLVEAQIHNQQKIEELKQTLALLSDREQELISLKYAGGLTNRAIAELLNMSESNVGTTLYRCMQKLRNQLGELI